MARITLCRDPKAPPGTSSKSRQTHQSRHLVATHADASEPGPAADRVLDKIEKQLRKVHDKRIFAPRREARRERSRR